MTGANVKVRRTARRWRIGLVVAELLLVPAVMQVPARAAAGPPVNVFIGSPGSSILEVPAGGGPVRTVTILGSDGSAVAVDAAGDIYAGGRGVQRLPSGGGAPTSVPTVAFAGQAVYTSSVAVSSLGDVFIGTEEISGDLEQVYYRVVKTRPFATRDSFGHAGTVIYNEVSTGLAPNADVVTGLAPDAIGGVYMAAGSRVKRVPAVGGAPITIADFGTVVEGVALDSLGRNLYATLPGAKSGGEDTARVRWPAPHRHPARGRVRHRSGRGG